MHISESITYAAPPADVLAMLRDPQFQQEVADRSDPLHSSVTAIDGGTRVERTHSAEGLGLPSAVRLDEITLVQVQQWDEPDADGSARGTVAVEVQGLPVRFDGTLTLAAAGTGSVETLEGELVAKIPLVGGKIEKAAAPAVLAATRLESRVGADWLAAH